MSITTKEARKAIQKVQAFYKDPPSANEIKRQAITELLALHEQDRAKVNSQCDTLINMSTVKKYLESL